MAMSFAVTRAEAAARTVRSLRVVPSPVRGATGIPEVPATAPLLDGGFGKRPSDMSTVIAAVLEYAADVVEELRVVDPDMPAKGWEPTPAEIARELRARARAAAGA